MHGFSLIILTAAFCIAILAETAPSDSTTAPPTTTTKTLQLTKLKLEPLKLPEPLKLKPLKLEPLKLPEPQKLPEPKDLLDTLLNNNKRNKREEESNSATNSDKKMCKGFDVCSNHDDCHGGQCVGTFIGKCNCNACIDFWLCESDAACGGLKGACNNVTKHCDCNAGFRAAGFPLYIDALNGLCNTKSCTTQNANKECFGLPCNVGRCLCGEKLTDIVVLPKLFTA
ncbi:unnamed protein product [Cylicocyclus nassatus]|uniref:Chondroitin proteoglycan 3 n=1 Tax=Cylicocyclus nassatus TaxID=53992 RepID=A0AA36GEZ7_CYLNA|nr:unnamed protein product [Cylicocyclus nassatus]